MTAPFLASPDLAERLARIADALERIAPPPRPRPDFAAADAFVWRADRGALEPIAKVNRVDISLLHGVDRVRDLLIDNTLRFARACRPTTRCCGARAAWANRRWSRRRTPRSIAAASAKPA